MLDSSDAYHVWTSEVAESMAAPWMVCEPALTEAWHLLRRTSRAQYALLDMVESGVLRIAFDIGHEARSLLSLCRRYANVPMSLADACAVRMAETMPSSLILTLDRDFLIYRKNRDEQLSLVAPFA